MSGQTQLGFGFDDSATVATWTRPPSRGKCDARWHHSSGWTVAHCGHPTALWPYHLLDPARSGALIVSDNGHGFTHLAAAKAAVEGLINGSRTTERGGRHLDRDCVVPS